MGALVIFALNLFAPSIAHADMPNELRALQIVESSDGQNTEHALVTRGVNAGTFAGGRFGIMPKTALEAIKFNPNYFAQYQDLLDKSPEEVSIALNTNHQLDLQMASFLWGKLRKDRSVDQAACSWYFGPNSRRCKGSTEIMTLEYVAKFNRALNSLTIARYP